MTIEQIFIRFLKEEDYYSVFISLLKKRMETNTYYYQDARNLHEIINKSLVRDEITQLINNILNLHSTYLSIPLSERSNLLSIIRKWKRFCNKNIKFDESLIKVGDNITFAINNFGRLVTKEILDTSEDKKYVYVNLLNRFKVPITSILEVNGEKLNINYYVKRNRKIYGKNEE